MPLWSQHLLVALAVMACIAFIARHAVLSLRGRKSRLNGCGTCNSCGTNNAASGRAPPQRIAFLPAEMLGRRR